MYDTPKAAHFEAFDRDGNSVGPSSPLWYASITGRWAIAKRVADTVTGNMLAARPNDITAIDAIIATHTKFNPDITIRLADTVANIAHSKGS